MAVKSETIAAKFVTILYFNYFDPYSSSLSIELVSDFT